MRPRFAGYSNAVSFFRERFMLRHLTIFAFVAVLGLSSAGRLSAADNEGQADLDRATEVKLTAESIDDLNLVINLAQGALNRGLDATNTDFAKKLLASTL